MPEADERKFTIRQVCERWQVTRQTLWKWRAAGILTVEHLGPAGSLRIRQSEVERFEQRYHLGPSATRAAG